MEPESNFKFDSKTDVSLQITPQNTSSGHHKWLIGSWVGPQPGVGLPNGGLNIFRRSENLAFGTFT